jgi:hypothetical protein
VSAAHLQTDPVNDTLTDTAERLIAEGLIGLLAAARLFPPGRVDRPTSPATVGRWCRRGVKMPDGRLAVLEHTRVGGRWCTSRPAVARFLALLTSAHPSPVDQPAPARTPTPARRQRAAERAAEKLREVGI